MSSYFPSNLFIKGRTLESRRRITGLPLTPADGGLTEYEFNSYQQFTKALGKSVFKHSDELLGDALKQYINGVSTLEKLVEELA